MKKPTIDRCLISELFFDRRRAVYVVDVLHVDDTLNFATRTGTACTVYLSREQYDEARRLHQARSKTDLIGAPILVQTKYEGGNVLGSSTFLRNTL